MYCDVHRKVRTPANLVNDGTGRMHCRPESECRVGPPTQEPTSYTPPVQQHHPHFVGVPLPAQAPISATPPDLVICTVHGKRRVAQQLMLQQTEYGLLYVCRPDAVCCWPE